MWKSLFASVLSLTLSAWGLANPPELAIQDLDGKTHTLWSDQTTKATVVVFVDTDCPIANSYQPLLRRLAREYAGKGVAFFQVHPDPDLQVGNARQHVKDFAITVPVAIDHDQSLTKKLKATTTPEVFVLTRDGKTAYRGRIDNSYSTFGKRRPEPTENNLKDALDAVLAGKKIAIPVTKPVGCLIFLEKDE